MRKVLLVVSALAVFAVAGTGCSTTGHFVIPQGHTLKVTDRTVTPNENGEWKTSPFFWSEAGGARYRLYDANGKMVRTGKLKTGFRVVSIFWPPFALIYWPMGLRGEYDMSQPADGEMVRDETVPANTAPIVPASATTTSTKKAKKK